LETIFGCWSQPQYPRRLESSSCCCCILSTFNFRGKQNPIRSGRAMEGYGSLHWSYETQPCTSAKPSKIKKPGMKQQVLNFPTQVSKKATIQKKKIDMPGYPWKYNSCWLDTSLELTYITLMRNFEDFAASCDNQN